MESFCRLRRRTRRQPLTGHPNSINALEGRARMFQRPRYSTKNISFDQGFLPDLDYRRWCLLMPSERAFESHLAIWKASDGHLGCRHGIFAFPARLHIPPSILSRWAIAQHLSFGIGTPVPRAKKINRAMDSLAQIYLTRMNRKGRTSGRCKWMRANPHTTKHPKAPTSDPQHFASISRH